jgi:hypothetical protein
MIRLAEVLAALVAASLLASLYFAKSSTGADQQQLARIEADLARERGRISALEAEIAHQEDPENLRRLARLYLGFEPVRSDQEIDFADLPRISEPGPGAIVHSADLPATRAYPDAIRRP